MKVHVAPWIAVLVALISLGTAAELRAAETVIDGSFAGMSSDGRFIAFLSSNPDLVEGDTKGALDLFLLDRTTADIERVGLDGAGFVYPAHVSADGSVLVFNVPTDFQNPEPDCCIRIHDRQRGTTEPLVVSPRPAFATSLTDDGHLIAFETDAPLIPGDIGGEGHYDVHLWDRRTRTVENVSVRPEEFTRPSVGGLLTPDGRFVVYTGTGDGLGLEIRDRSTGATEELRPGGSSRQPPTARSISEDGRFVAFVFPNDFFMGPGTPFGGLFVWDRAADASAPLVLEGESDETFGVSGSHLEFVLALSGDGCYALFSSSTPRLVPEDDDGFIDLFLRDRELGITERIARGTTEPDLFRHPFRGDISRDGSIVVYSDENCSASPPLRCPASSPCRPWPKAATNRRTRPRSPSCRRRTPRAAARIPGNRGPSRLNRTRFP
jgi:hypothetical protein